MLKYQRDLAALMFTLLAMGGNLQAVGQSHESPDIVPYNADFFASSRPASAFEMIGLIPGFQLQEGDSDVRGLSGATGNVLIDGQMPATKQENLETLLLRIPASGVVRIELIRSASAGYDMHGYTVIANVVRDRASALSGRTEIEYVDFKKGASAQGLTGQLSYSSGTRTIDVSGSLYRDMDDEHGFGTLVRRTQEGQIESYADYAQPEGEDVHDISVSIKQAAFGGELSASALIRRKHEFADIEEKTILPGPESHSGSEREDVLNREFSLGFDRQFGERTQLTFLALRNGASADSIDRSVSVYETSVSEEKIDKSESIARLVLRTAGKNWSLEGGAEVALNILDSENALEENGERIFLPAADVRVEERRAEGFLLGGWTPVPEVTLEVGGRYEVSEIEQSGDNSLSKGLTFFKPRFAAHWAPGADYRLSAVIEREVGQLDFGDFVSSPSLTTGEVTAGNVDLEPDSLWRFSGSVEKDIGKGGITLTIRHEELSDVVDHIPVSAGGNVYDAIGNIGNGTRDEIEINLTLPLDRFAIRGATLSSNAVWRKSRISDPSTGQDRPVSDDVPIDISFAYKQYIDTWRTRIGVELALPTTKRTYKIDEIKSDDLGERLEVFLEYLPDEHWKIRVFGRNLTDTPEVRTRQKFDGLRSNASLAYAETRELYSGQYAGVQFTRTFP